MIELYGKLITYGKVRYVKSKYPLPSGSKKLQQEEITNDSFGNTTVKWVDVEEVWEDENE